MSLRQALIVINAVAVGAIVLVLAARVLSLRRNPEPTQPQNKTPFFEDEDLEGRKLERVLGWSLLFTVIIAVALPVYFLVEPDRQVSADQDFEDDSIERGAVLFANAESPDYDSTRSLQCANCHGVDGQGGSAMHVVKSEAPGCDPDAAVTEKTDEECRPAQVAWRAPALDVVLLRYPREQVVDIVTFGRPGTPMPAWGVASGEGVLNEQGIDDVVNYLESIQITPEEAKKRFTDEFEDLATEADDAVEDAEKAVTAAEQAVAEAELNERPETEEELEAAQASLDAAIVYRDHVRTTSDGQLLFELQCARCHTKGWSYYDPLDPDAAPPPGPQGGGAFGPNLREGSELRQFPGMNGVVQQVLFVAEGVVRHKAYGVRGISSGRMPHFNETLTEEQIAAIVDYERGL